MDTRKWDIIELVEKRKKAKSSFERDMIDRALYRIKSESKEVEYWREKLILAFRAGDRRAIERFQHELMNIRARETWGRDY